MGQPATIIMTDFVYTNQIIARLIIKNPGVIGRWVSVNVKAFKGTNDGETSLIGHKYIGYWRFPNIFQTIGTAPISSGPTSTTTNIYPTK